MPDRTRGGAASGWTLFAAVAMLLVGFWWILTGVVGLTSTDFFVATRNYTFRYNNTTWGWIHVGVGTVVALSGIGLFSGAIIARVVGVALAFISALVGFFWIPWYPFWAILIVAVSFFVIWALVAHGRDVKER